MGYQELLSKHRDLLVEILAKGLNEVDIAALILAAIAGWIPEDVRRASQDIDMGNSHRKLGVIISELERPFKKFLEEVAILRTEEEKYRSEVAIERDAR